MVEEGKEGGRKRKGNKRWKGRGGEEEEGQTKRTGERIGGRRENRRESISTPISESM